MSSGLFGWAPYEHALNKRKSGTIALPGSDLEHRRNLEIARAGNTSGPNRTPSASHLAHLSRTGGAGDSGGPGLMNNAPPSQTIGKRKRKKRLGA